MFRKAIFPLIGSLCVAGSALAEEPQTREQTAALLQSSFTTINGKETPELVPYEVRMQHFFYDYKRGTGYQAELKSLLSAEDQAVLQEYSSKHVQALKKDEEDYLKTYLGIASRAKDMSAMEIAAEINKATANTEASQRARYRSVAGQLSAKGRQLVDDFAFKYVRPIVSLEDQTVVAQAAPEFYKTQIVGTYELTLAGKVPPPPARPTDGAPRAESSGTDAGKVGSSPIPQ